ncbi:MAG: T9SS type A sorting domain-containing protein [Chitinophagales bacterium]|nr:T9SS type A sorting domain-containing protein [Chitinophagales bacterium]
MQGQENCQAPVFFEGEPESGFCMGQLPTCTTILGTTITQSSQIPGGILSGTICIEGDFTITSGSTFTFLFATILISPEVEIRVDPSASLLISSSDLHGCNGLWKGIKLLNNTELHLTNNSLIEDARKAVNASYVSTEVYIDNTTFNRNLTGVWLEDSPNSTNPPHISTLFNSNFTCDAPIVGTVKDISENGIYTLNCPVSFQEPNEVEDHHVIFEGLKYGIKTEGARPSIIRGNNFYFYKIKYSGINMQRGIVNLKDSEFVNFGDYGVSLSGPHGLTLDHCSFRLVETDPDFFASPSSANIIRAGVTIGFDPLFPGIIPGINILNKSNFIYDCPGVDEIFHCINLGGIGTRFDLLIYDNDFLINGQNSVGINVNGGYNLQSNAEVLLNRFDISTPIPPLFSSYQSYGIRTRGVVHNLHIVGNVFDGTAEPSDPTYYLINSGIVLEHSSGTQNKIISNRFYGELWSGATILNSENWKICSNRGFFVNRVFLFDGDNLSLDVVQNRFQSGGFDIRGTLNTQAQKDNLFESILFATYARCLESNCWIDAKFEVRQNPGTLYYPVNQYCGTNVPSIPCSISQQFFFNVGGQGPAPCADEFQEPGDEEFLESIAENAINDPEQYPFKVWHFKNHLFGKLKQDSSLLLSNSVFSQFLNNELNSTIGKFYEVNKLIEIGLSGNQSQNGWNTLQLENALSLNASISTNTVFELNQKQVNQILIELFLNQEGQLTEQQITQLNQIATQCPKTGGSAVIQAGLLLEGCNNVEVDLSQNCSLNKIPPINLQGETEMQQRAENTITFPTNKYLKAFVLDQELTIILPINSPGIVQIFDLSGKLQYSQKVYGTADYISLETGLFPSGVYFIKFNGNNGDRIGYSSKVIISH